jgi:hypothetical protein
MSRMVHGRGSVIVCMHGRKSFRGPLLCDHYPEWLQNQRLLLCSLVLDTECLKTKGLPENTLSFHCLSTLSPETLKYYNLYDLYKSLALFLLNRSPASHNWQLFSCTQSSAWQFPHMFFFHSKTMGKF